MFENKKRRLSIDDSSMQEECTETLTTPLDDLNLAWNEHNDYFLQLVSKFYDQSFLTDISLICQGNVKIGCHKIVLASHSNFFHKIFSEQLSKATTFAMVNTQSEDMKILVEYMYSGKINMSYEALPRVLELANFLDIKGFKENLPTQNGQATTEEQADSENGTSENGTSENVSESPSSKNDGE